MTLLLMLALYGVGGYLIGWGVAWMFEQAIDCVIWLMGKEVVRGDKEE